MSESKQLNVTPNDKEIMKQMLSGHLSLEYIGVHIVKYNNAEPGQPAEIWFTVPERSEIKRDQSSSDTKLGINTSKELINTAKQIITELCELSIELVSEDDDYSEALKEFNDNPKDYIRIYCRVREGDIWTEEKGVAAMGEAKESITKHIGFREV